MSNNCPEHLEPFSVSLTENVQDYSLEFLSMNAILNVEKVATVSTEQGEARCGLRWAMTEYARPRIQFCKVCTQK